MKLFLVMLASLIGLTVQAAHLEVEVRANAPESVDYQSYNFGTVKVLSHSYVRYNVTNTGDTALTFKSAMIGGSGFSAYHTCEGVLQPQQKCAFEIEYWPPFEGLSSGRFYLTFVEDSEIQVDLWGQAVR